MRIFKLTSPSVHFGDLCAGDVFYQVKDIKSNGVIEPFYMKCYGTTHPNDMKAVDLVSGMITLISHSELVHKLDVKLVPANFNEGE